MKDTNRYYRIRTNVNSSSEKDKYLNINLNNDIDTLEILSLKLETDNFYRLHTSDYGCVVGRVIANNGIGVPNAKISIFIQQNDITSYDPILRELYPYKNTQDTNDDNIRYNILPSESVNDLHTNVGTFPSKRLILDDDNILEIFDNYYKLTTRSNNSGDYMLMGVPVGQQTLHVDVDLSDVGYLSQRPYDMIYKGYDINQFENSNKFKTDTNLNTLPQIKSQNFGLYVYPFWGEETENDIKITRNDIEIDYKFEPTCVFMGSVISDEQSDGISTQCIATDRMGKMNHLTTGEGKIEMIRKNITGGTENFSVRGDQLIDGNGTWCYQIPMNLDYMMTDEYGKLVPSDSAEKGIPTRCCVRFRMSMSTFDNTQDGGSNLTKILVPNNPEKKEDLDFSFGSETNDSNFKNLFSNCVYTIKSFIPRVQKGNDQENLNFTGIKNVNVNEGKNPLPYNNIRINLTFMFMLQCAMFKMLLRMIAVLNRASSEDSSSDRIEGKCTYIGDGLCPDMENWYFAPGCYAGSTGYINAFKVLSGDEIKDEDSATSDPFVRGEAIFIDDKSTSFRNEDKSVINSKNNFCFTNRITYLIQCVEMRLAMEYDVIQFDFYNDWLNGVAYIPRFFRKFSKKLTTITGENINNEKIDACDQNFSLKRNLTQQCALWFQWDEAYKKLFVSRHNGIGCKGNNSNLQKCHNGEGRKYFEMKWQSEENSGLIYNYRDDIGNNINYTNPCIFTNEGKKCNLFATDIVMLGTLDEYSEFSIPNIFENMVSSTYKLPTNIVKSNMNRPGNLYFNGVITSERGTVCSGRKHNETIYLSLADSRKGDYAHSKKHPSHLYLDVKQTDGVDVDYVLNTRNAKKTFDNYKKFVANTEYNDYSEDLFEYPMTESSGIDWGVTGPNQYDENDDNLGEEHSTNAIQNLFQPGGHFLSVSCSNSETNIRSCVNLSRICEYGATWSKRKNVNILDNGVVVPIHIAPNGLISREELVDNNFRHAFATMNHNNLRVVKDDKTKYYHYDLIDIPLNDFGGELREFIGTNNTYFNSELRSDNPDNRDYEFKIVNYAVERGDSNYTKFRLGLSNDPTFNEVSKKFLINNGQLLSMPMYNNSFYFYFGLRDGSTALEEFIKNFYTKREAKTDRVEEVLFDIKQPRQCYENDSLVDIVLNNFKLPVTFRITEDDKVLNFSEDTSIENLFKYNEAGKFDYTISNNTFSVSGLASGTYKLVLTDSVGKVFEKTFVIILDKSTNQFSGTTVNSYNFLKEKEITIKNDGVLDGYEFEDGGYLEIANVNTENELFNSILIVGKDGNYIHSNNEKLDEEMSKELGVNVDDNVQIKFNFEWEKDNTFNIPVWSSSEYTVYLIIKCEGILKANKIGTYFITMPFNVDLCFNDNKELRLKNLITKLPDECISGTTILGKWVEHIFDKSVDLKSEFNDIKKIVLFRGRYTDLNDRHGINIKPIYGLPPYTFKISGTSESFEDVTKEVTEKIILPDGTEEDINTTKYRKCVILKDEYDVEENVVDINNVYLPTHRFNNEGKLEQIGFSKVSDYDDDINHILYNETPSAKTVYTIMALDSTFDIDNGEYKPNPMKTLKIEIPIIYRPFYSTSIVINKGDEYKINTNLYNPYQNVDKVSFEICGKKHNYVPISFEETFKGDTKVSYNGYINDINEKTNAFIPNKDEEDAIIVNSVDEDDGITAYNSLSDLKNSMIKVGIKNIDENDSNLFNDIRTILNYSIINSGMFYENFGEYGVFNGIFTKLRVATVTLYYISEDGNIPDILEPPSSGITYDFNTKEVKKHLHDGFVEKFEPSKYDRDKAKVIEYKKTIIDGIDPSNFNWEKSDKVHQIYEYTDSTVSDIKEYNIKLCKLKDEEPDGKVLFGVSDNWVKNIDKYLNEDDTFKNDVDVWSIGYDTENPPLKDSSTINMIKIYGDVTKK